MHVSPDKGSVYATQSSDERVKCAVCSQVFVCMRASNFLNKSA